MIEEWFPTKIYYADIDDSVEKNAKLEKHAYDIFKKYKNEINSDWNCDTFNTLNKNYKLGNSNDDFIEKFIKEISQHVFKYAESYGLSPTKHLLTCDQFWFNIAKKGNYQEYHQHPNSHFSIVYYVKSNLNSGNTIFKNHSSLFDSYSLPSTSNNFNYCTYEPKEGRLLIFRSNLLHMVEKNKNEEDRISISANFTIHKDKTND